MFLFYRCCLALQEQDSAGLQAVSASIRGRGVRISEVVTQEMDGFEAGDYSDRAREAVKLLQTELIPNFERNLGLQVNLAFLSSTTLVEMLAVWMRRWAAAETGGEKHTLVQRR